MSHPFPGMNPWLENPTLWRSVHHRLLTALADALTPLLRPRYFVDVETHTYVAVAPEEFPRTRYPDVLVVNRGGPAVAGTKTMPSTPYLRVGLPWVEPVEEGYLEVRAVPGGEIVTVIELLSHANKRPGPDRDSYLQKRAELLRLSVSFVEIDLLRAHPPMPNAERVNSQYRFFIRRSDHLTEAHLYPISLRDPLPIFPLPLRPDDSEPPVDLGALLQGVYDRAGYDMVINYQQPPTPPLSDEDAAWAAEQLGRMG